MSEILIKPDSKCLNCKKALITKSCQTIFTDSKETYIESENPTVCLIGGGTLFYPPNIITECNHFESKKKGE